LKILHSNPLYADEHAFYKTVIDELWPQIEKEVFAIDAPYSVINFPEEGGVTGYFGRNMNKDDLKKVSDFLLQYNKDANGKVEVNVLNTRAFKSADGTYIITVGSVDTSKTKRGVEFQGNKFDVVYGEFQAYVKECSDYMKEVLKYAAGETQENMVKKYIEHFESGDIDAHKDSQRHWVKDKGPVVESNIGWIETYIDPTNERGYFEGWVAVVDKPKSAKF
jgi:dipeptidyl-peptidase-3